MKNTSDYFQSSDLGCCAALVSDGFELQRADKSGGVKVVFVFKDSIEINDAVEKYWSGKLFVDARAYFDNLRMLKSRIYGGSR